MGKEGEDILKAVGIVLLGKIIFDALKKYRCPRCNYPVDENNIVCPNCGQVLDWRGKHE